MISHFGRVVQQECIKISESSQNQVRSEQVMWNASNATMYGYPETTKSNSPPHTKKSQYQQNV